MVRRGGELATERREVELGEEPHSPPFSPTHPFLSLCRPPSPPAPPPSAPPRRPARPVGSPASLCPRPPTRSRYEGGWGARGKRGETKRAWKKKNDRIEEVRNGPRQPASPASFLRPHAARQALKHLPGPPPVDSLVDEGERHAARGVGPSPPPPQKKAHPLCAGLAVLPPRPKPMAWGGCTAPPTLGGYKPGLKLPPCWVTVGVWAVGGGGRAPMAGTLYPPPSPPARSLSTSSFPLTPRSPPPFPRRPGHPTP